MINVCLAALISVLISILTPCPPAALSLSPLGHRLRCLVYFVGLQFVLLLHLTFLLYFI